MGGIEPDDREHGDRYAGEDTEVMAFKVRGRHAGITDLRRFRRWLDAASEPVGAAGGVHAELSR